jgi:hypothetical protein
MLIAGVTLPIAGCAASTDNAEAIAPPDPDLQLRDVVIRAERRLLAHYDAVATAHPDLAERLTAYTARHEAHLAAVLALTPIGGTPGGSDQSAEQSADVPADPGEAVATLRTAEQDAAAQRIEDSVAALDFELAQTLASIAACESAHDRLLRGLA